MKGNIIIKVFVNFLTLFRLVGSFFLPLVLKLNGYTSMAIFCLCLFLTDLVDGFIARKLRVSTFFGASMDALSDKVLGIMSLSLLTTISPLMIIPLIIEILIVCVNAVIYRCGGTVKSSIMGKIKTTVLGICVVGGMATVAYIGIDSNIITALNIFALLSTIACLMTCGDYFGKSVTVVQKRDKNQKGKNLVAKTRKEFFRDAFDTDFFLEHRNDSLRSLVYKEIK